MGAGHAHAPQGGRERPVTSLTVRRALAAAVGVLVVGALVGLVVLWPSGPADIDTEALDFGDRVGATVVTASVAPCSYDPASECAVVAAEVTSGPTTGDTARLESSLDQATALAELAAGDRILLNHVTVEGGEELYSFADFERRGPLLVLLLLFVVAVVALGRWRGLLALAGLGASLLVLFAFILPSLLRGNSPVGVALTGAVLIAVATLFLAHGVNERTSVALLGTVTSLLLTAGLAVAFASAARLTGLATEESINLFAFAPGLDFRGLLLAAVIIGSLGVLDDVTVTQTSAVWELHRSDPDATAGALYSRAIRIGRDHIASTVNTLVLAYAAAALPLLLLFSQAGQGVAEVLVFETIAIEIVQTLVGSIGLVASVPITTGLAAYVVGRTAGERAAV
jgi:uncharacterized membrane protein